MEDVKFSSLCSHFKDTFDTHKASLRKRDILFYLLLVTLSIFTLQLSSTDTVQSIVTGYLDKNAGIKLAGSKDFISTLLWLLLFGFSIKYYQAVMGIERQYKYLHALENEINKHYEINSVAFTREGKCFYSNQSLFSNWIWVVYTLFFPALIIFCINIKLINKITSMEKMTYYSIIDFSCLFMISVSAILYIHSLHIDFIKKFASKLKISFRRY